MSESVFSFFKQNVGEEDVIKLLLLSAGKALVTVAIIISAILSYFKLGEWYGFGVVSLAIILFTIYMIYTTSYIMSDAFGHRHRFSIFHYKTWKYVFEGMPPVNKMMYFDINELNEELPLIFCYLASWAVSIVLLLVTALVGIVCIYLYAFIVSIRISIIIPPEALLTDIALISSVIIMSALFLKLKWRKIWINGFNLNLAAWCICASIIITTISFVAGVAIRRIAGYIGIEYTAILVSSYVIITAIYVYLDLKQWLANKEHMARMEASRVGSETGINLPKTNP